jgi:hypothetical protein
LPFAWLLTQTVTTVFFAAALVAAEAGVDVSAKRTE